MPDLAPAIMNWRAAVADLFRGRDDVLDELESHLWDAAEHLCATGLPPEEAVRVAAERLGAPAALAAEFDKVPARPLPWWPARLAWVGGALLAVGGVAPLVPRLASGDLSANLAAHVAAVTLGYTATVPVAGLSGWLLLIRLFRAPKAGHVSTWRRTATAWSALAALLTAAGIAFGTTCPLEKNGWCAGLDTRELGGVAIALWNVAVFAYLCSARSSLAPPLVGAAGGAVVVLGWLAAARVESQSYGAMNSVPTIALLLAAIAVVGLTAFAPAGCLRTRD